MRKALGELDPGLSAGLDNHLASCSGCTAELAELRESSGVLKAAAAPAAAPPQDLWNLVEAKILAEAKPPAAPSRRGFAWGAASSIAVAAALVVVAYVSVLQKPEMLNVPAPADSASPREGTTARPAVQPDEARPQPESVSASDLPPQNHQPPERTVAAKKRTASPLPRAAALRLGMAKSVSPRGRPAADKDAKFGEDRRSFGIYSPGYVARESVPERRDGPAAPRLFLHPGDTDLSAGRARADNAVVEEAPAPEAGIRGSETMPVTAVAGADFGTGSADGGPAGIDRLAGVGEALGVADVAMAPAAGDVAAWLDGSDNLSLYYSHSTPGETGAVRGVDAERYARAVEMVYMSADARAKTIFNY